MTDSAKLTEAKRFRTPHLRARTTIHSQLADFLVVSIIFKARLCGQGNKQEL